MPKNVLAQGKYAGDFKSIIGTRYIHENEIPKLKGFQYSQGIILGEINPSAPYFLSIEVVTKGKIDLVILHKLVDATTKQQTIIEVLKMENVSKNYEIKISSCSRKQGYPNETIVAIVVSNIKKQAIVKQAFALKDIRFEEISTKGVQCLNNEIE
jgi:hypothetical protein